MQNEQFVVFRCIEVEQPIGVFYVGSIDARVLAEISFADMRRIEAGKARDIEEFSGIQRPLSITRVKELVQYVNTVDASFPTSIILHVSSRDATYADGVMRLSRRENVAKIIDGQHRIAGVKEFSGPQFQLNVTVFVDMDLEAQALLFATINLKQTKVSKSLAYDLYEFAAQRSPQKTCHNIARLLNGKEGSPFYHRIKILGTATKGREETLTQAAFVDQLLPLVSDDPMRDRDALKRGIGLSKEPSDSRGNLVFRSLFVQDRDAEIAKNIWNFFAAVADRWPAAWEPKRAGLILNRTTGFAALMRFLRELYRVLGNADGVVPLEAFKAELDRIQLESENFTRERYLPGTSGQSTLFNDLMVNLRDRK